MLNKNSPILYRSLTSSLNKMAIISLIIILTACFSIHFCNGSPMLLLATGEDIRMANVSRPNEVATIMKDLVAAFDVDFFFERELVCWSNRDEEKFECAQTNGTHTSDRMVVNSSVIASADFACDWYTGILYWTNYGESRIEVISLDGRHRKVLFRKNIDRPAAIALVPMKSILFWTDWGHEAPKIERAAMNGDPATREVIVSDDIVFPNSLTVDYENELVYWVDTHLNFISVMDYYGKNRRKVVEHGLFHPRAVTFFDHNLYFTDWKTSGVCSYDVGHNLSQPRKVLHEKYPPLDIKVWDVTRQPRGTNPCEKNNGNCSHFCLLSMTEPGYTCACPIGVKLVDNFTCAERPQEFLLIVRTHQIFQISLDSPDYVSFVLPLAGMKHAMAIDFDPVQEMLYWTDACAIHRATLNGSNQEDIITTEVENPNGIAVDWLARNLYWTDRGTHRIEVARLNGTSRKVLINEDLMEPAAIAVAPELGWMFWADSNSKRPAIERSNLDGTERILLVTEDIDSPSGIALDLARWKIYWCDAETDKIEVCNMDGTDRRVITDNVSFPSGLSLIGDYLYWADRVRDSAERAHKLTGGDREVILRNVEYIMSLKAVHLGRVTNPCAENNGGCSHLCLNRPENKYVCACQNGYELTKDKKTCVVPDAFMLLA